jgi:hypothetical protein
MCVCVGRGGGGEGVWACVCKTSTATQLELLVATCGACDVKKESKPTLPKWRRRPETKKTKPQKRLTGNNNKKKGGKKGGKTAREILRDAIIWEPEQPCDVILVIWRRRQRPRVPQANDKLTVHNDRSPDAEDGSEVRANFWNVVNVANVKDKIETSNSSCGRAVSLAKTTHREQNAAAKKNDQVPVDMQGHFVKVMSE